MYNITSELSKYSAQIREELFCIIKKQLDKIESDKIAIALSGGIDSTVVAYLLKRFWHGEIEAFTLNVQNFKSVERDVDHAIRVAEFFDIPHRIVTVDRDSVLEAVIPVIGLITPGDRNVHDFNVFSGIVTYLLAPSIKRSNIKICFSGEGFDELSGSYGPSGSFQKTHEEMITAEMRSKLYNNLTEKGYIFRTSKVMEYYGIQALSPYIDDNFKDLMLSIPERYFDQKDWKLPLIKAFESHIPFSLHREKVRAQIGSGVFQVMSDSGINQQKLESLHKAIAY